MEFDFFWVNQCWQTDNYNTAKKKYSNITTDLQKHINSFILFQ